MSAELEPNPKAEASGSRAFTSPVKRVKTIEHMPMWRKSELFSVTVSFIARLNSAVRGVPGLGMTFEGSGSEAAKTIAEFLDTARGWVDKIPPAEQAQRFGNKSFRIWHDQLSEAVPGLLKSLVGPDLLEQGAGDELAGYLLQAFGSRQRIDYGTGHELCFVTWLTALSKLNVFARDDAAYLVAVVFYNYLRLMRRLQTVYWLEPAGSKGVWGLDDYQFLPFLWGSSQLCGNPDKLDCSAVLDYSQEQADRYMYLDSVRFVQSMKKGLFQEHSGMLYQTGRVASWEKVNNGMVKLYDEEVLNKFPVVQHILFGSILTFAPAAGGPGKQQSQQQSPHGKSPSAEQGPVPRSAAGAEVLAARRPLVHGPGIQIASVHARLPLRASATPAPGVGPSSRRDHAAAPSAAAAAEANPAAPPKQQRVRRQSFPETFE